MMTSHHSSPLPPIPSFRPNVSPVLLFFRAPLLNNAPISASVSLSLSFSSPLPSQESLSWTQRYFREETQRDTQSGGEEKRPLLKRVFIDAFSSAFLLPKKQDK